MAQIAIPLLLLGTAVLISNEPNDEEEDKQNNQITEGLANLRDIDSRGNLLSTEYDQYYPNIAKSKNNINNDQDVSQYQDKYFLKKINENNENNNNQFKTLAGEKIKYEDINHNNMNLYYGSKTNGIGIQNNHSILDSYTGQGTYDIKKEELATMFKPEDNAQNVYGNQNKNDFFQSRVQPSHRQANSKPWEEIQVSPGIGKEYNQSTDSGYNNYNESRELWLPKTVDELRATNNPKNEYCLNGHMGPALKPVQNRGVQGKIVKQGPDGYFVNKDNLGMIAGTSGPKMHTQSSEQMLTKENRDNTSIEYYGARGNNKFSYTEQNYTDSAKQQLGSKPMINYIDKETNPTNLSNYGKKSYNVYANNRTTTKSNHFGNVQSSIYNLIQPVMNGLRHSKKENTLTSLETTGNVGTNCNSAQRIDGQQEVNVTNREIYESELNMNHLNVQKQQDSAYMNTNPVLNATQRNSMNQSDVGPASSNLSGNMSYVAQYNQRNNDNRVSAENITPNGNMNLFNNKIVSQISDKECSNSRSTPVFAPTSSSYNHPSDALGMVTSMPQNYQEISNTQNDESLLNAFKQNPYTQPLNSA